MGQLISIQVGVRMFTAVVNPNRTSQTCPRKCQIVTGKKELIERMLPAHKCDDVIKLRDGYARGSCAQRGCVWQDVESASLGKVVALSVKNFAFTPGSVKMTKS